MELKPCPFCGGEAKVCGFHYSLHGMGDPKDFCVVCNSCSASSYHYADKPEKAIEAWNRRADVARELPDTYCWFTGDGETNHFREGY